MSIAEMQPHPDSVLSIEAARLYHMEGIPQKAIATRLRLSPATVSRLLARAKSLGLVRVVVVPPPNKRWESELLRELTPYGIRTVHVCPPGLVHVGLHAARLFEQSLSGGGTVVLDGGLTVAEFVNALTLDALAALTIIPIAADPPSYQVSAYEAMTRMAAKFPVGTKCLKVPYWPRPLLSKMLRQVRRAASKATFVALGVGPWNFGFTALAFVKHLGLEPRKLRRKYSSVVAVCGYVPLREDGSPVTIPELNRKMPRALDYGNLKSLARSRDVTVAILAHAPEKVVPMLTALRAGMANTIIIDEDLAVALRASLSLPR